MSEKKPMPKCPYCGWEMQHLFDYPMNYCDVRFYCKHCNAMAPSTRGCQTNVKRVEEALEEAYEKAMRRYEEPNRVLTLEEVMADADAFRMCASKTAAAATLLACEAVQIAAMCMKAQKGGAAWSKGKNG